MLVIKHPTGLVSADIGLTPSKSLSNRALIISALTKGGLNISNLSSSNDTNALQRSLIGLNNDTIDADEAGTAYRFLTSFLSIHAGKHILTGSERMKSRPIGPLVIALRSLGAEIQYLERDEFPSLQIVGRSLKGGKIKIDSSLSSQFVSSLMLIGPVMSNGLIIEFSGKVTSRPYIEMTAALMNACGAEVSVTEQQVEIRPKEYSSVSVTVENDWSAASYWFEVAALAKSATLKLQGLQLPSMQGDSIVSSWMEKFGVHSKVELDGIHIHRSEGNNISFQADFSDCPDLAMTFAALCVGKRISARLSGLDNLVIKESDRLRALEIELKKLNPGVVSEKGTLVIPFSDAAFPSSISFDTYNDHRLAMSLAPLALIIPEVRIEDKNVVNKSYPEFWKDMEKAGFILGS